MIDKIMKEFECFEFYGTYKETRAFLRKKLEEQEKTHKIQLHEQYERYDYITDTMEKNLRLDDKGLDKILKDFYEHMCGVDDYGCELCLKYKQDILDLQGEK